jgi:hypothetical protein
MSGPCRLIVFSLFAVQMHSQQTYVTQFDAFAGYTYLNSLHVGFAEHGFHTQFGANVWTWLSVGFDYSVSTGDLTLTPDLLLPSLQQLLAAQLAQLAAAGLLPPGYKLAIPVSSLTQTFAGGPQIAFRHWKTVTIFVRPSVGLVRESATPHATDPINAAVNAQLARSGTKRGTKRDTTPFYGFGGGVDRTFRGTWACESRATSCATICSATCSKIRGTPSGCQPDHASTSAGTSALRRVCSRAPGPTQTEARLGNPMMSPAA